MVVIFDIFSHISKNGIHTDEMRRLYEEMEQILAQERESLKLKVKMFDLGLQGTGRAGTVKALKDP